MAAAHVVSQSSQLNAGPPRQIGGVGGYKELAATSIISDIELKGSEKSKPASYPNYLPVWDNEKGQK